MLAELRDRFLRRTPKGGIDVVRTAQNLVTPLSTNEIPAPTYLESLAPEDRQHVEDFLSYARTLHQTLFGNDIAVTAVGSTVMPEARRHHPPADIDLRILNSAPPMNTQRMHVIDLVRVGIKAHLEQTGLQFEEDKATVSSRMVESTSWDGNGNKKKGLTPFLDWYNNDPSITVHYPEGLPLQLSISGIDNWDLPTFLNRERQRNNYFALLLDTRPQG